MLLSPSVPDTCGHTKTALWCYPGVTRKSCPPSHRSARVSREPWVTAPSRGQPMLTSKQRRNHQTASKRKEIPDRAYARPLSGRAAERGPILGGALSQQRPTAKAYPRRLSADRLKTARDAGRQGIARGCRGPRSGPREGAERNHSPTLSRRWQSNSSSCTAGA